MIALRFAKPSDAAEPSAFNLDENVFHCHKCQAQGDVIDLWAKLHHQTLRQAALDLARTFDLEPAPTKRTEKRNG